MKKNLTALVLALGIVLSGCAHLLLQKSDLPTVVEPAPTETVPADTAPTVSVLPDVDYSVTAPDALHAAYRSALDTIHDELYFPVLAQQLEPWDSIESEKFAIIDFDGDGKEELVVSISDTFMAGMMTVVYGFTEETGSLYTELVAFPMLTVYPGLVREEASHNHGMAGDVLWPYRVHRYNPATDTYEEAAYADAWSKEYYPKDWEGNPFPEKLDTDNKGAVYLITENGTTRTVSYSDYLAWEVPLFAGLSEVSIPWQELTDANIAAATHTTPKAAPTNNWDDFQWNGEILPVTPIVYPERIEIRSMPNRKLLVVAPLPEGAPAMEAASYIFDDLTDDGYSDIQADISFAGGEKGSVLWLSDGQTLYYNEEFSLLPGQVPPKGED